MGITDIRRKFSMDEMASGDVIFSATGVTDGSLLDGVHFRGDFAETETVVLRSKTGTVRRIKTSFRMIGTKAPAAASERASYAHQAVEDTQQIDVSAALPRRSVAAHARRQGHMGARSQDSSRSTGAMAPFSASGVCARLRLARAA